MSGDRNMGVTADLAAVFDGIKTLTDGDRRQLHTLIIDFFAAAYAGAQLNRAFCDSVGEVMLGRGGTEESTVLFGKRRYPAQTAAFMNALYGHGAELDDGNKKAMGHIGVHVIPAVFALADRLKSRGEDLLLALAVGYEAYIRISAAAQPGMVKRGFHSTGMAGALACAAACAKLYGLNAGGIENAIALSTTMSSGLLSYGDSRPAIKPLNPAAAAERGLFAAELAAKGVLGPTEALEGPNGWFHAVTDSVAMEMLKGSGRLLLHECYIKLYPSCRHTHCGIEAALGLRDRIGSRNVEKIRVHIYPNAIRLAGQIKYPKDGDETKFSIHYTLACALAKGAYGVSDMDPPDLSANVRTLIDRIELIPDERMEDRARGIRGTRVEILTEGGEVFTNTVETPKGDPENPLSREEVVAKLRVCAGERASEKTVSAVVAGITAIGGDKPFENPMKETETKSE